MERPIGFSAYMSESVPMRRWELLKSQQLLAFFMLMAISANPDLFGHPVRVLLFPLAGSLLVCGLSYISERYRERPVYVWVQIILVFTAIVILVALAWRHQANKASQDRLSDSRVSICLKQTA